MSFGILWHPEKCQIWTKTIGEYTGGRYSNMEKRIEGMPKLVFRFAN